RRRHTRFSRDWSSDVCSSDLEAIHLPNYPGVALAEFVPGDGLYGDPTNWWAPTMPALCGMALAAGFSSVEPVGPGLDEAHAAHRSEERRVGRERGPRGDAAAH